MSDTYYNSKKHLEWYFSLLLSLCFKLPLCGLVWHWFGERRLVGGGGNVGQGSGQGSESAKKSRAWKRVCGCVGTER